MTHADEVRATWRGVTVTEHPAHPGTFHATPWGVEATIHAPCAVSSRWSVRLTAPGQGSVEASGVTFAYAVDAAVGVLELRRRWLDESIAGLRGIVTAEVAA